MRTDYNSNQRPFDPSSVLKETLGEDFVNACHKRQSDEEINEENYKLSIVRDIAKNRKLTGQPEIEPDYFYYLLDLDVDRLERLAADYEGYAELYMRDQNPKFIQYLGRLKRS